MLFTATQAQLDRAFANFYGPATSKSPRYAFAQPTPKCWKQRNRLSPNVFDLRSALLEILKEDQVIASGIKLDDIRLELKDLTFPAFALDVDLSGIAYLINVDFRNSNLGYSIFDSRGHTVEFECCKFPPQGKFVNVSGEQAIREDWVESPVIQAAIKASSQSRMYQFFRYALSPVEINPPVLVSQDKDKAQNLAPMLTNDTEIENLAPAGLPQRKRAAEKPSGKAAKGPLKKAAKGCLKIDHLFATPNSASPASMVILPDTPSPIFSRLSR
ncbi:MAG: hypothetical protein K0S08_1340 [Gammaproteobacteria bacterium]|jgi:hypothetical protein|nr:hypothetical protein [Gammaproteobacteria bacterium]